MRPIALATLLLLLFNGAAYAQSMSKTVSYFNVGGHTIEAIEAELNRRGPPVGAAGTRHPGATQMQFFDKVAYGRSAASCRIDKASVILKVRVILPRWVGRRGAAQGVALVWDTLASDIKRHEERHVEIARGYARDLQNALKVLRPRQTCDAIKADVAATTATILGKHNQAQDRFDRIEGINFENRFQRLLEYRLKKDAAKS